MRKIRVFISYSSKDREAAESIHERLAATGFDVWRDQTRLETDWSREIAFALAESDVLCLIWTEHSAGSKWVRHEWLTARALEKRIIPCLFPTAPTLPQPLYNLHGVSFPSLEEGSKQLIGRVNGEAFLPVKYDYKVLPGNSYIPFNPNPFFTGRHADLLDLYLKMIGNLNKIGINQVGTVGMGGIGKTQLAVEFAYRLSFGFEGIYWVQAADPYRWADEFISIARDRLKLNVKDPDRPEAEKQYIFALQDYFKNHPNTLVVMDNVAEPKILNNDAYLFGIPPLTLGCDLLFTTRKHFQLPGVSSQSVNILSSDAAYNLLKSHRVPETPEAERIARAICNAVGYLPLAIILAGAYLRDYQGNISFSDYSEELGKKKLGSIDIGSMSEENLATRHVAAVKATLQSQWEMLKDENARYLFKLAGQFPEGAIIPKARLGLLAGIKPGQSRLDQPLAKALNQLHDLCLLERLEGDASAARLHPLVRDFSFKLIPEEERGSFRGAAAQNLKDAYFDYPRLEAQVLARGVQQVIDDLQVGLDWWGIDGKDKQDLELLHGALRLSSHVLVHDPAQLAGQVIGRLIAHQDSRGICSFLAQTRTAKRGPWLCPYSASMDPSGGPLIRTLTGHTDWISSVSVKADGRWAVSGSGDKTLKVWDLETGRELRVLKGHTWFVSAVAVTPNGLRAVSGSGDKTLKVWDLETGRELRTLAGHGDCVSAVSVTLDGKRAVSGSWDKTLKVWDLETGRELRALEGHADSLLAVSVTPDGKRAVSGSSDKTLKVWDLETGRELRTLQGHTHDVNAVAVTPDGKRAVSGSSDKTLKVWDLETGRELRTLQGHTHDVNAVSVTPDGKRAVSGSHDRTIRVWDLETGRELWTLEGHAGSVEAVSVTLDGRRAVSGSSDITLKVWYLETGREVRTLKGHAGRVTALSVTPDGRRAVSGSSDTTLKVWDLETGRELWTLEGHTGIVYAVAVMPDGRRVVSGSEDKTIKIWELETGRELRTLEGHTGIVYAVAVMPDGRRAVSGSGDGTLRVWDLETGREPRTLEGLAESVTAVSVTPDGRRAVSGSADGTLKVWDLETGRELRTPERHVYSVLAVSMSPDGRRAVSGSWDKTLKVWDLETGRELKTLEGHAHSVYSVSVTPDGRRAVSGSEDKILKVWDLEKGEEMASFSEDNGIRAVALGPDGKILVAGDGSGRVHFLRLEGFDQ